jgi:hypothetical protein
MAAPKFLRNNAGTITETLSIATSAGAGDADKLPATGAGGYLDPSLLNAATTGVNKVVLTNGSGRLDPSIMPLGFGDDVVSVEAGENLSAGDLVNIYDDSGTAKARKADATNNRPANGFVVAGYTTGQMASIYFEGTNDQMSGMVAGRRFLSATTPGATQTAAPTGTGQIVQIVGFAVSATQMNFEAAQPIVLA